jgi:decaprenylphospho-beta-D-erythro-pentofuranosid-2-ulose 2-reductase
MQTPKHMLLVGANSDIGRAIALHYAQQGWQVLMAARDVEAAKRNAKDIAIRTATQVLVFPLDILESDCFSEFLDCLPALPDTIVCVVGMLGEQPRAQAELDHSRIIMRTNFEGPALLLGLQKDLPREAQARSSE